MLPFYSFAAMKRMRISTNWNKGLVLGLIVSILNFGLSIELTAQNRTKAQSPVYEIDIPANYTKREVYIPMRDGTKLFTVIYSPKQAAEPKPMMLLRTPYSVAPYGDGELKPYIGPSSNFAKAGYIIVYQDVRGKYMSEGEFVNMRPHRGAVKQKSKKLIDESSDTYDTIEWLLKNVANHNGKVGMWGISYPGYYASMGLLDAHPALKAVSPQAPIANWFFGDDFHHHGAFLMPHAFNFYSSFGQPRPKPSTTGAARFNHGTPDGYDFFLRAGSAQQADDLFLKGNVAFWKDLITHTDYDTFWQARNTLPHFKQVKPAVLVVGGWYDTENLYGALNLYKSIKNQSPETETSLVMGPWYHGQWARDEGTNLGAIDFGSKTSEHYRNTIEFPFFDYYLRGKGNKPNQGAHLFRTGANVWDFLPNWPENKKIENYFLRPDGVLSLKSAVAEGKQGSLTYTADPAKPVPSTEKISTGMPKEYMVEDQRYNSRRTDVLTFSTPTLTEDITLSGYLRANLWVSTSGTDADYFVKLIDVFPDTASQTPYCETNEVMGGYQQLLRWDVVRARYRNNYSIPEAMPANTPTRVAFLLNEVHHTFKKGHKIMVQVHSHWFPFVDRNPQQFINTYTAKPSDYKVATHSLHALPNKESYIEVGKP